MLFCENFKAILIANDDDKKLITRTRCKMWSCDYCAEKNRSIWRAKIINGINVRGGQWCWFTLTAHGKQRSPDASLKNLRNAWDKLIKRMKRKYGKFAYVRVYEEHKDGAYHCHAIGSFNFDDIAVRTSTDGETTTYSRWLAKTAKNLKIGYYTHAANIELDVNHHAGYVAAYVTKYIVKLSPQFRETLGRVRHIQTSQGWPKKQDENELEWMLKTGYYDADFANDMRDGIRVIDTQTGEIITSDNFIDNYVYPPEFSHTTHEKP